MKYELNEISTIVNGKLHGNNSVISRIFIDSRNQAGEGADSLFVAIRGERHDGHRFVEELFEKGIRNFLVNNGFDCEKYTDANFVTVENTLEALHRISADYRNSFSFPVLGITGSNGKTCVKEWICRIFQNQKKISRSPKSYNSQTGVPLSILIADAESELGIFEAGISMPDEMKRLEKIIRPNIGIFTNIGDAHQENFKDIEHKIREKLKLFADSHLLIYCSDQIVLHKIIAETAHGYRLFTWGRNENCNLQLVEKIDVENGTSLKILVNDANLSKKIDREQVFEIPFSDLASVENIMHCIAFALTEGIAPDLLRKSLANISPVAMRLEMKAGINNCIIINDSYNSDVNSLTIALDFLNGLSLHTKKTVILSDILQSERNETKLYRQVSELLRNKGISKFVGIGEALERNAMLIANNANIQNCVFYANTDIFLKHCHKTDFADEAILLKGSRPFKFETISRLLELKIHQTVLEINMNALVENLNHFRSKLKPDVKLMAMVKAFSYGHGGAEIASLLQYHRVDYLAVACADEGISLREAGIGMPIVVLNPDPDNFDIMIDYRLEPEIYSIKSLEIFIQTASGMGVGNYPVHLKIDTGMHRFGLDEDDLAMACNILKNSTIVRVASVFSHLVASDEEQHDEFTRYQIDRFCTFCDFIEQHIGTTFIRHILNSSGIERFPEAQFDMVRLGIGLYGVGTEANRANLIPVGTLSSAIVQIRNVDANQTVGYSRNGYAVTPRRIATVPIGYADGLNRKLGKGAGYFMVNGQPAPIVGTICMDACMIDLTGLDANESDRVVVMGENPSVYHIANIVNTIPYEILTSISQRVKRIFVL
ncbi:MAG: bifunctional UDP-N-acetylmuramoyl-tripeptide:D-alanyl-D-alanine ligase/alanine racemase [Prevotellaceae bacterium]|jgi:alanine racemase|nr:bifunctional UDP-N-acetylmuramoyl-tripeptide:D-alanyl-D-alanine ligase/alanine racemase [Prevotellaceae bacterium]